MPRVSIGLPVYNGERYLKEVLDSILAQTFEDFELTISDNASTDRTQKICREYASKDKRILYYCNSENIGASKNYNRVFELSNGKYFKWAASDDLYSSDYLKKCVDILDRESEVILSYPKTKIINESGAIIKKYEDGLNMRSQSASGRFLQFMYNVGLCNAIFGLIRSNKLGKTRLIGNYVHSDIVLLGELSLLGQFREIPHYMFFRRLYHDYSGPTRKENFCGYRGSYNRREIRKQLEFIDPKIKNNITLPQWRHLFEHLKSISRTPVRGTQKVLPIIFLFGGIILSFQKYMKELGIAIKDIYLKY